MISNQIINHNYDLKSWFKINDLKSYHCSNPSYIPPNRELDGQTFGTKMEPYILKPYILVSLDLHFLLHVILIRTKKYERTDIMQYNHTIYEGFTDN